MKQYEQKLKHYMRTLDMKAEQLVFRESCHSVEEAANAVCALLQDFVKNICMVTSKGDLIVAIVKGEDRASTSRIAKELHMEPPRTATAKEILTLTGYPCGGVPSFGYSALFLIDPKILEKDIVYSGGGSPNALVRISPTELLKANCGHVVKIRK